MNSLDSSSSPPESEQLLRDCTPEANKNRRIREIRYFNGGDLERRWTEDDHKVRDTLLALFDNTDQSKVKKILLALTD